MPRNSSGVYQLPAGNPVVSGTLIESVWANSTMADLAQAMSDSLDRFGRSTMAAPFLANDGTISAPGIAFGAESSTGLYRKAAKVLAVSVGGMQIAEFTQTAVNLLKPLNVPGITSTGDVSITGNLTLTGTFTPGPITTTGDITLADGKAIKWGDGSAYIQGNGTTDVIAVGGVALTAPNFYVGTVANSAGTFGVGAGLGGTVVTWGNTSAGAGNVDFATSGGVQARVLSLPGAVNYLTLAGSTAGSRVTIANAGASVDVGMQFVAKGAGDFVWWSNSSPALNVYSPVGASRYVQIGGSATHPVIGASAGMLNAASALRVTGGGITANDVASNYALMAAEKLSIVDAARTADNRVIEQLWNGGKWLLRFLNDGYSAAVDAIEITGGYASGITDLRLLAAGGSMSLIAGGAVTLNAPAGLTIDGTSASSLTFTINGVTQGWIQHNGGSALFVSQGTKPIGFYVNGAEQAMVHNGVTYLGGNGNGLLGIQNSAQLLYILGGTSAQVTDCAQLVLTGTAFAGAPKVAFLRANQMLFTNPTASKEYGRFESTGQFLVGTTAAFLTAPGRGEIDINGSSDAILGMGIGGVLKAYILTNGPDFLLHNTTGTAIQLQVAGATRMSITPTQLLDQINGGIEIGWRDLPQTAVNPAWNNSARGKMLPLNANYIIGAAIAGNFFYLVNVHASTTLLISPDTPGGVTMYMHGTTASQARTLAVKGVAMVWFFTANVCYIWGDIS
jgi:hypothetical protein